MKKSHDAQNNNSESHNPSRRKFLKGVGIAGAGAAVVDKLWIEAEADEQASAPKVISGNVRITLDVNGQKRSVDV